MNSSDEIVGPINLGNPGEYTIKELAELTIELVGSDSKLIFQPLPPDDPTRRRPDITLAKKHLDWEPKVSLREGLSKTIEWFKTIQLDHYRPPTPNF
jgi:UDP-glucuronate decarboxylase